MEENKRINNFILISKHIKNKQGDLGEMVFRTHLVTITLMECYTSTKCSREVLQLWIRLPLLMSRQVYSCKWKKFERILDLKVIIWH